jgi:excisionase family DNA binding protein
VPLTSTAKTDHVRVAESVQSVDPDLITVPEAARRIGIHSDTLYRLARTGAFSPAIKIGARWRVSVPRLERYLHGGGGDSAGITCRELAS